MRKALIVHPFMDVLGGAELLSLSLAMALKEEGFEIVFLTVTPLDKDLIMSRYGIDLSGVKVLPKEVPITKRVPGARLRRLVAIRNLLPYINEMKSEYVTVETQSNVPTSVDVSYIHFPALLETYERSGTSWRIYNYVVRLFARRVMAFPGLVATNSLWAASRVYEVYGIVPEILYPPVRVELFSHLVNNERRERIVVTVSRFTPEKGLEKIVEVASKLREYKFVLIGSTGSESEKVIGEIIRRTEELKLDNVLIKTDVSREELLEYLGRARYYLHPPFVEHFGVAVVEAMAAGTVPIVYRDGGAWYDVVRKLSDKLGYNNVNDIVNIIKDLDSNEERYETLRMKSPEIAKEFSYTRFRKRAVELVEKVRKVKELLKA